MSELVEQVARAIAGPMQDAWQEFMTEAEAALSVLEPLRESLLWCSRHAGGEIADDASLAELKYVPEVVRLRIEALERDLGRVRAEERERAARIARSYEEGLSAPGCVSRDHPVDAYLTGVADAAAAIEDAIRSGDAG